VPTFVLSGTGKGLLAIEILLETSKNVTTPCVDIFHHCQMQYSLSPSTHDSQILVQRSKGRRSPRQAVRPTARTPATSAQLTARLHTPMIVPPESLTGRSIYLKVQDVTEAKGLRYLSACNRQSNRIGVVHMDLNSMHWSAPNLCAIEPSDHPSEVALTGTA